jgi:hypothetical protein
VDVAEHFPSHLDSQEDDYDGYPHWLSMEEAQSLADSYCVEKLTMNRAAEEAGISRESFLAFRRAHSLRKGKAVIVDETKSIEEGIEHFSEEAKRREIDRKARRKQRRERDKAARRWWELEQNLEEAAEAFQAEDYDPPKPSLTISSEPPEKGAVLLQGQDWHVGKRPSEAKEGYMSDYIDALKEAFADSVETAMRLRHIEKLYLVTGGDLIHVDGPHGTTNQTPQDLLVNPSEAFQEAVELLVWCIDYVRSLSIEVHVLTVMGNHDRTLSSAAGVAVQQRFHDADDVVDYPLKERVYTVYGDTLIMSTHGDMKKKQWRELPSIMMSEARDLLATTSNQIVTSGHLHFQSMDLEDKAGTLFSQASSPSPADEWHYREGYSTSRRAMEMLVLEPEGPSTSVVQEPVTV